MSDSPEMKALMAKALAQSLAMAKPVKPLQRRLTAEEKRQKKLEKQRKAELGKLRHEQEMARARVRKLKHEQEKAQARKLKKLAKEHERLERKASVHLLKSADRMDIATRVPVDRQAAKELYHDRKRNSPSAR
jgi:hypothetical protein